MDNIIDEDKLFKHIDEEIDAMKLGIALNRTNIKSYNYGISLLEFIKKKIENGDFTIN